MPSVLESRSEMSKKEFGRNLRKRMREVGVTRAQLAERCGRDLTSVSKWVTGRNRPRPDIQARIAIVLVKTVPELWGHTTQQAILPGTVEWSGHTTIQLLLAERLGRVAGKPVEATTPQHWQHIIVDDNLPQAIASCAELQSWIRQLKSGTEFSGIMPTLEATIGLAIRNFKVHCNSEDARKFLFDSC